MDNFRDFSNLNDIFTTRFMPILPVMPYKKKNDIFCFVSLW